VIDNAAEFVLFYPPDKSIDDALNAIRRDKVLGVALASKAGGLNLVMED
jgi:hypothetical protein